MVNPRIFSVILLLAAAVAKAQPQAGLDPELNWRFMRERYATYCSHTMLQPWNTEEIRADDSLQAARDNRFKYFVRPLAIVRFSAGTSFLQTYGAGVHAGLTACKNLSADFNYTLNYRQFSGCDREYIDSTGLIPHYDRYLLRSGNFYMYQSLNFSLSWTPVRHITLSAGKDRRFWGDGYRSLYLSDNANSYPFLQTVLKVWHIKYAFMVMRMSDGQLSEHFGVRYAKYASMHALSWDITPAINVNLFESVVWNSVDSVSKRTVDINYLNPVIMLRPVDFSLGSPDNILVGAGLKIRLWRENYLYGQFVLDEFKSDELKAANGWWANKYAFQAGARCFFGKRRPAMLQAEFNQVRPFCYTHYYPLQNYGHLADALAHPMGANLREGLAIARWAFAPKWSVHAALICAVQGTDSAGANLGANIYKSNLTRTKDYGNVTLQGVRAVTSFGELKIARTLADKWNMQVEAGLSSRSYRRNGKTRNDIFFSVALKTLLYRD